MGRVRVPGLCMAAAVAAGAVFASACCASASAAGLAGAPLAASLAPAQAPSAPVSPLLAKELAVLTDQGISSAHAWRAIDAQGKFAHADLGNGLARAMGSAFGGTWFEPATAQMHVGVTSRASRRAAERVIARAGLAANAMLTTVRSTMDQLIAVQREWNRKLAPLFARQEVTTGIEPQRNAVIVTLGSAVPASQRAALEREAAGAGVNVFVQVAASPDLAPAPAAAECNNFNEVAPNANCNPSITAGVQIERPREITGEGTGTSHLLTTTLDGFAIETLVGVFVGDRVKGPGILEGTQVLAKPTETSVTISRAATRDEVAVFLFYTGSICTAGPAAIPLQHRAKRVLVTAGHCILAGHGAGSFWFAYNRNAEKLQLGAAGTFQFGGAAGEGKGDFGEIAIEPAPEGKWQTSKVNRPVLAVTAEWKKEEETRYKVKGERRAEAGDTNCHEGRTSGEWCGTIKAINVTYAGVGSVVEGLVSEEKVIAEEGDSGGPFLFIEANNEVRMEGTVTAGFPPTCTEGTKIGGPGPENFVTEEICLNLKERLGTGLWKRSLGEVVWEPLKTSPLKIPEGSLEKLKLELLTTANERIAPEFNAGKLPDKLTTLSNESRLETVGGRLVKCKASKGEGEVGSATELKNILIKFTGCRGKILGEAPCKSAGAAAEEIVTKKLKGIPVYIKSKEAGILGESQEAGTPFAEFKCESIFPETVKVKGALLSKLTPINSSTKTLTLLSNQIKGAPFPSEYENENGEKVKAKTETKGEGTEAFGYEESGWEAAHTLTAAEAVEVEA